MVSEQSVTLAIQDFRRARRQAAMRQMLHRMQGKSDQLLAYNEVCDLLKITDTVERGVEEIELDKIVGSVGRAEDFTRDFLPKRDSDAERWARVKAAVIDMQGWPPIEVYKMDEVYFVIDGNHRVSVAKQLGSDTITANVTEVHTRMPIKLDDDPDIVITRANRMAFFEQTELDQSRPEIDFTTRYSNQYGMLLSQIEAYHRRLAEENEAITLPEAAAAWADNVYMPVVKLMREQGLARNFEGASETDLYVQLSEHLEQLHEALGWEVTARSAVANLAVEIEQKQKPVLSRLMEAVVPSEPAKKGPPPGQWRRQMGAVGRATTLFREVLVSLQGTDADWRLLDDTLRVARREQARVLALHAVETKSELTSAETLAIQAEFEARCEKQGVEGEFAAEVGDEGKLMLKRAAWVDLVTTNLTFATEPKPDGRISSGVTKLIQRCPRPILVLTDDQSSPMNRALLAYDGRAKADEALYVAAYLASTWPVALTVVTVETDHTSAEALERAKAYLTSRDLHDVDYMLRPAPIADAVFNVAQEVGANLLIIGGFGYRSFRYRNVGSTVTDALQRYRQPLLICR